MSSPGADSPAATPALPTLLAYFARLGAVGFGGPIALVASMRRDLVETRHWFPPGDYAQGLAFAQLSPGPLAAQLAMYLGWLRAGAVGAMLSGAAFVLPSFLMVIGLAALYVRFGRLGWIHGAFYGIGAAVIAVIARSALKLVRTTLKHDRLPWVLFALSATVTIWTAAEVIWLFVLSGAVAAAVQTSRRPQNAAQLSGWIVSPTAAAVAAGAAGPPTLGALGVFFLKASAVVFGSGLAIVPFLYGGVVADHHWLTDEQFLDAIAVAMITPGPVVITAAFIGYLVAGTPGAVVASLGVFGPPCLIVVAGAPFYRKFAQNPTVAAFVRGVTAAAVGAIVGAAVILGRRAITDAATIAIAGAAFLLIWRRVPEPLVILLAGAIGILLSRG